MPPHYRRPQREAWDRFMRAMVQAATRREHDAAAARPQWTNEQYAVGVVFIALDHLMAELDAPKQIRALTGRLTEAWEDLKFGRLDPLFVPKARRRGPQVRSALIWFRAKVLCWLESEADKWGSLTKAADAVVEALGQANLPEDYRPTAKTIQDWREHASQPRGETEKNLAELLTWLRSQDAGPLPSSTEEWVAWIAADFGGEEP